jgi:hypothetical protein
MEQKATLLTVAFLVCVECRRPWLDPQERWRLYLDPDETGCTVPYCQLCAEREFGRH